MVQNVIRNTKVENYRPECQIVAVNKNVTSRFFNGDTKRREGRRDRRKDDRRDNSEDD